MADFVCVHLECCFGDISSFIFLYAVHLVLLLTDCYKSLLYRYFFDECVALRIIQRKTTTKKKPKIMYIFARHEVAVFRLKNREERTVVVEEEEYTED